MQEKSQAVSAFAMSKTIKQQKTTQLTQYLHEAGFTNWMYTPASYGRHVRRQACL
jgi:hypothetical protein